MKPFLRSQLERYAQRLGELDFLLSREDIMSDMAQYRRISVEHAEVTQIAGRYARYQQREADLVAARERVEASMQDVRAARAQFYPSVNLSAFAGVNAIGFDQLFKTGSRQMGAGPALRLPLFETGHLRAQLKGSAAEQDAAVASYNQVLLEAVREAADQLGSLQSLRQQAQAQAQLAGNIDSQYALVRQRTEAGLGNRLGLLQAQQAQLQQQRQQIDLQAQSLETQINLMRALGGGYQDRPAAGAGQPG